MDLVIAHGPTVRLAIGSSGSLQYAPITIKYDASGIVQIMSSSGTSFVTITPPTTPTGRYSMYLDPLNVPYIDVGERKRKREEDNKKTATKLQSKKARKDTTSPAAEDGELEAKHKRKEERKLKREFKSAKAELKNKKVNS